jgi:hypothetical protein
VGTVVGIVAFVVALVGLLAALGHVGYLAMLRSAARTRGAAGGATEHYVSGRWARAGGTAGVAALGLLLTTGGLPPGRARPARQRRRRPRGPARAR